MTYLGDKDLSLCAIKKAAIPLNVENKLTLPLECNAVMDDFESYKKSVAATTEANLALLNELPPPRNFSLDQLTNYLKEQIRSELEKDTLFENLVEVATYANSMTQSLEKYFKNIFQVDTKSKERNLEDIYHLSRDFLNSDLPERFINTISTSFLVENDFTDLFDRRIRKEYLGLIATRHNKIKFGRICNEHNRWVNEFNNTINALGRNRTKLIWYIDINNSNSLEELFKDKYISTRYLDNEVLTQLLDTFEVTVSKMEALVAKNIECIPKTKTNDSVIAFTRMMEIIGS